MASTVIGTLVVVLVVRIHIPAATTTEALEVTQALRDVRVAAVEAVLRRS
jgi:hypothetical protein